MAFNLFSANIGFYFVFSKRIHEWLFYNKKTIAILDYYLNFGRIILNFRNKCSSHSPAFSNPSTPFFIVSSSRAKQMRITLLLFLSW